MHSCILHVFCYHEFASVSPCYSSFHDSLQINRSKLDVVPKSFANCISKSSQDPEHLPTVQLDLKRCQTCRVCAWLLSLGIPGIRRPLPLPLPPREALMLLLPPRDLRGSNTSSLSLQHKAWEANFAGAYWKPR